MAARGIATLIGLVGLFTFPAGIPLIVIACVIHLALQKG